MLVLYDLLGKSMLNEGGVQINEAQEMTEGCEHTLANVVSAAFDVSDLLVWVTAINNI